MVSMLTWSEIDRGFEPWSGLTKDYEIGICCFSAKHAALRKNKDWLAQNQDNVSEWDDMSICRLLFQWASTINIQLSVLVLYKADTIIILLKINLFSPWYSSMCVYYKGVLMIEIKRTGTIKCICQFLCQVWKFEYSKPWNIIWLTINYNI
jgi:hypothetical protein